MFKTIIDFISRVNDRIAIVTTNLVGTMTCTYLFLILVLIPLVYPQTNTVIQYISSSVIQLVMLPLLLVGQSIQGRVSEERAKKDHKMIRLEMQEIKNMIEENKKIHAILDEIQTKIK